MANRVRKSHFLIPIIGAWINAFIRQVLGGAGGGAVTGTSQAVAATVTPLIFAGHVRYTNPPAADLVSIVAALDPPVNGAMTIVAQPVVPRKLNVRIVYAGAVTGNLVLVGVGVNGQAVGQTIPLVGGTRTVITTDAYAFLTSATIDSIAGAAGGDTVGIGQSTALGLPSAQGATAITVYRASVNDVREATGTGDTVAGTTIPTTAANGAHDYDFWYTYTVTPVQPTHTHTAGSYAAGPATSAVHGDRGEYAIDTANASSLPTSIALTKALLVAYAEHRVDTLGHLLADATNTVASTTADVVDLPTVIVALNQLKTAFNAHRSQAGVHVNNDAGREITAANASDQGTSNTLANELKADFNLHIADGYPIDSWRMVDG